MFVSYGKLFWYEIMVLVVFVGGEYAGIDTVYWTVSVVLFYSKLFLINASKVYLSLGNWEKGFGLRFNLILWIYNLGISLGEELKELGLLFLLARS